MATISAVLRDEPKPPSEIRAGVPRELERIIARCLRKDPGRRFQHMEDLRVALEEVKEESEDGRGDVRGVAAGGRAGARGGCGWPRRWRSAGLVRPHCGALPAWRAAGCCRQCGHGTDDHDAGAGDWRIIQPGRKAHRLFVESDGLVRNLDAADRYGGRGAAVHHGWAAEYGTCMVARWQVDRVSFGGSSWHLVEAGGRRGFAAGHGVRLGAGVVARRAATRVSVVRAQLAGRFGLAGRRRIDDLDGGDGRFSSCSRSRRRAIRRASMPTRAGVPTASD